ncbi:MAG: 7-cyano-7-deazaguanine synthase [Elusimicrobiota bacterium]
MPAEDMVVLFSGGTDSTLAAALAAESGRKIHLVTYDRFGLYSTGNTRRAAQGLSEKFGADKVTHTVLRYDGLFRHASYERYLSNLTRHGFFVLSTCGLCKLAMHIRTIVYCLDHGFKNVCDGANKGMDLFPAQMDCVIDELKKLYARFGIAYTNPVFDYEPPAEDGFLEKDNLALIKPAQEEPRADGEKTAGRRLRELGLAPADNIKGTAYDRERQPRCFQFILFNVFAKKYYLASHSLEEYREATLGFFRDKISRYAALLLEYRESGAHKDILKS